MGLGFKETKQKHSWGAQTYLVEVVRKKIKEQVQEQVQDTFDSPIPEMIHIEGGDFMMGSDDIGNAKPAHLVKLGSFEIGKYPVTQRKWKAIMGTNPSDFKGDDLPVDNISWNDCQEYITKLNEQTSMIYRLPTEAEWEYAAGGGAEDRTIWAGTSDEKKLNQYAWHYENSNSKTHPVGQLKPNALGLYDMSGNIEEWCQDWYGDYPSELQTNPAGSKPNLEKVARGGSWFIFSNYSRVANRAVYHPDVRDNGIGFRLCRSIKPEVEQQAQEQQQDVARMSELVHVPGGKFTMGSDEILNERPAHPVQISSFEMGKYPVTNEEFVAFLNDQEDTARFYKAKPTFPQESYGEMAAAMEPEEEEFFIRSSSGKWRARFGYEKHPVVHVSWEGAKAYCEWLSKQKAMRLRLPTEAEWEFVAKQGLINDQFAQQKISKAKPAVQYDLIESQEVGQGSPNSLGISDLNGNVKQWCNDWYDTEQYQKRFRKETVVDPKGPDKGSYKVVRGSAWDAVSQKFRPSQREAESPGTMSNIIGFRIARTVRRVVEL